MPAAALALGVMLSWSAPAPCKDEPALRADVEALLGRSLSDPFARWVDVRATVKRAGGKFVLELGGDGSGGPFSRTLDDPSCDALADAAALIVALAIDPSVMEPPPVEAEVVEVAVEVAVEAPVAIEYAEAIPARETSGLPFGLPWPRVGLSVLGAVEGGVHPDAGGGLMVAGALLWSYLRLEGSVGYWFAARVEEAAADVSLIAAGGRVCPTLPWVIEASLCAGIDLGQLRVDPISEAKPGRGFWGDVALGGALAWEPIEMLAFRASGEAFWSAFRPSHTVDGRGEIYRPSRFGGRGTFGIEVRFF